MTPTEFREARQALGLTQAQMAAAMRMQTGSISQVETGKRQLSDTAAELVRAMLAGYRPDEGTEAAMAAARFRQRVNAALDALTKAAPDVPLAVVEAIELHVMSASGGNS